MVASKHTRSGTYADRQVDAPRATTDTVGPDAVEHLLDQATRLTLRAPELALVLGERAAALSEASGSNELWVRSESLVVLAGVRLGVRAPVVGRAVAALRAAEDLGQAEISAQLRTDLALSARSVGLPLTGLAALRPVLSSRGLPQVQRAAALCQLVGCMGQLGRKPELDRALLEADRLCQADEALDEDTRLLSRALLRVAVSGHRRRHGDLMGAADAARTGLGLLDDLRDQGCDGNLVRSRLVLELVCALLDRGSTATALELAQPILDQPHRAAVVGPAGWLRLAVATRVYLPAGSGEVATRLMRDAVHGTERHGLHALTARLWFELAHVEEQLDRPAEAIRCLHLSRAAEHVHSRARRQACALLTGEFGAGEQQPVDLDELIAAAPSSIPSPPAATPVRERALPAPLLALARDPKAGSEPKLETEPKPETEPEAGPIPVTSREPQAGREPTRTSTPIPKPPPTTRVYGGERYAPASESEARTRHDSEHGSVAARSVLDRLGISAGSGGRRRAADDVAGRGNRDTEPEEGFAANRVPGRRRRAEDDEPVPKAPPASEPRPDRADPSFQTSADRASGNWGLRDDGDPWNSADEVALSRRQGVEQQNGTVTGNQSPGDSIADPSFQTSTETRETADTIQPPKEPDVDDWLPRLRLPPSLAPIEALTSTYTAEPVAFDSTEPATDRHGHDNREIGDAADSGRSNGSYSTSFSRAYDDNSFDRGPYDSYDPVVPSEEPPPGAGLAELLSRALAEHQAGTSSAAALVKRLGSHESEPDAARRVNGRHRDDD